MEKNSLNGSFRKKRVYFSQVSNVALRDSSLTLKAKGLYSLIQSYITIENYILYKTTLKKMCCEGDKAFENTWKELKENGYLIQHRNRGVNGNFSYEYELLDSPDRDYSEKIHGLQNRKTQDQKNHTPQKVHMDKTPENQGSLHTPKKDSMDNGVHDKQGYISNTDSINTDLNNTITTTTVVVEKEIELVKHDLESIPLQDDEIKKLLEMTTLNDLLEKIKILKQQKSVQNVTGFLIKAIKENYTYQTIENKNVSSGNKQNRFVNFEQRKDYDFEALEAFEQARE